LGTAAAAARNSFASKKNETGLKSNGDMPKRREDCDKNFSSKEPRNIIVLRTQHQGGVAGKKQGAKRAEQGERGSRQGSVTMRCPGGLKRGRPAYSIRAIRARTCALETFSRAERRGEESAKEEERCPSRAHSIIIFCRKTTLVGGERGIAGR